MSGACLSWHGRLAGRGCPSRTEREVPAAAGSSPEKGAGTFVARNRTVRRTNSPGTARVSQCSSVALADV